jgi:hypothetical protein
MKITLVTFLPFATLCAYACIDAVKAIESEEVSALRNVYLNAPEVDEAMVHHVSKSEHEALEAVEGYYYLDEGNQQSQKGGPFRKLMMGSGSNMRMRYYTRGGKGRNYYRGKTGGAKGKGKGRRHYYKGKGKGKGYKPKPTPPTFNTHTPTFIPPTPPPAGVSNITCSTGSTLVTCDFANLTIGVYLSNPEQLRILQRDCGILSVTALNRNGNPREVNVKDDPTLTNSAKRLFIQGPRDGHGGCFKVQFNGGPSRQGVQMSNMILSELDAGATVQVSRDDFLLLHFSITTKAKSKLC